MQELIPDASITASGVLSIPALDLPSQGGRPADLGFGVWNNGGVLTHYTGAADYVVSDANTSFVGDVSGTIGATVVANDSHDHTASTLTLASTDLTDTADLLKTDTAFSGDVSGVYNATVVADDSHDHTSTTLTLGSIKSLSDVWASMTPTDEQVLYWDNSNSRWDAKTVAGGITTLAGLSDVTITSPTDGALLLYDTGTATWRDATMSSDVTVTDTGVATVHKLLGYPIQTQAPSADDKFVLQSGVWTHVSTSRVRAYMEGAQQEITENTYTKVEFPYETFDTNGEFNTTTDRFTASMAGYYFITAQILYSGPGGVSYRIMIYVNGSRESDAYHYLADNEFVTCQISDLRYLAATDYVEIYTHHNAAGALDLEVSSQYHYVSIFRAI